MKNEEDVVLMFQCIEDAKLIVKEKRLMESQSAVVQIAITLFNKRSDERKWKIENYNKMLKGKEEKF